MRFFLVVKRSVLRSWNWSCVCFTEKKNIINPPFFYQFWDEISLLHHFRPLWFLEIWWNAQLKIRWKSRKSTLEGSAKYLPILLGQFIGFVTRMFWKRTSERIHATITVGNHDLFPSSQRFMKVNWGVSSYFHLEESQFMLSSVLVGRRRIEHATLGQPTSLDCFIPAFIATNWICQKVPQLSRKKWQLYTTQKWPPSIPTKYDITYL